MSSAVGVVNPPRGEAAFLVTSLAFLALNFHFAPTYGRLCAEVLVLGWSALLVAIALSVARLVDPTARSRWLHRAQILAFVVGLVCTHVFVSINYLRGGEQDPESYEARHP